MSDAGSPDIRKSMKDIPFSSDRARDLFHLKLSTSSYRHTAEAIAARRINTGPFPIPTQDSRVAITSEIQKSDAFREKRIEFSMAGLPGLDFEKTNIVDSMQGSWDNLREQLSHDFLANAITGDTQQLLTDSAVLSLFSTLHLASGYTPDMFLTKELKQSLEPFAAQVCGATDFDKICDIAKKFTDSIPGAKLYQVARSLIADRKLKETHPDMIPATPKGNALEDIILSREVYQSLPEVIEATQNFFIGQGIQLKPVIPSTPPSPAPVAK